MLRLFSEESFRLMTSPAIKSPFRGEEASYGYGLWVSDIGGHTRLRHTGGMVAFSSSLDVDVTGGVGAFTVDNFPVFDYMAPNVYVAADSNHGYKMIAVGKEIAEVLQQMLENGYITREEALRAMTLDAARITDRLPLNACSSGLVLLARDLMRVNTGPGPRGTTGVMPDDGASYGVRVRPAPEVRGAGGGRDAGGARFTPGGAPAGSGPRGRAGTGAGSASWGRCWGCRTPTAELLGLRAGAEGLPALWRAGRRRAVRGPRVRDPRTRALLVSALPTVTGQPADRAVRPTGRFG